MSQRYIGSSISPTAAPTTSTSTTGVWSVNDQMQAKNAGNWPAYVPPVTGDTYWPYVSMLLPGNGTNGGQNNTFLDSSSNAFSLTRNGNPTQGTFSPFGTNWSCYFDGSGDSLSVASVPAPGTGVFTLEMWVYLNGSDNTRYDLFAFGGSAVLYRTTTNTLNWYMGSDRITATFTSALYGSTWAHIAICRDSSNNTRMFINGVQAGSTYTADTNNYTVGGVTVGYNSGGGYWNGYMSNVRLVNGTALYTSNFTPPTAPLTAITNTALLTCHTNRFIDGSTNNSAITKAGDVAVRPTGPFNFTSSYSASTNGGSLYFDGSGDYLSAANNAAFSVGTGAFTIDGWLYVKSWQAAGVISADYANNIHFSIAPTSFAGVIYMWVAGSEIHVPVADAPPLNTWFHVAAVRQAGGTTKIYINGVEKATGTLSGNGSTTSSLTVGASSHSLGEVFSGYMSNMRFVKGTALYTAAFTPPTAPTTTVSGTSLLLNGTNSSIIDNTQKTDLETVGNASISTAQSKWGGSSMYFDGTGDYLAPPLNDSGIFGTADFTIEAWIYKTDTGVQRAIVDTRGTAGVGALFYVTSGDKLTMFDGTSVWLTSTNSISANQWVHVAVARSSGTTKLFINGAQEASASDTRNYSTGTPGIYVGRQYGSTSNDFMGYMNDVRITKGYARYTTTFTPPTAAFPTS